MEKLKIITNGKLDKNGLNSIFRSFLITLGGCAIGFIANLTGMVDFGTSETIVATMLPFIANFLYKWLGKYETK